MSMAIWWVAGAVAILVAVLPKCGYSGTSKHKFSSAIGIILAIFLIFALLGRI
jgi:hypothetical protein